MNITNDAWSFSVPGAMQHMTMAVFRAVENRRSVVRATNAGITCLIDPNGRILESFPPSPRACSSARCRSYAGRHDALHGLGDWLPVVAAALALACRGRRRAPRRRRARRG